MPFSHPVYPIPPVYPILDTATLERLACSPLTAAEALLEAGATILQYRHKAFWSRAIVDQAAQIAELCRQSRAAFILNDRADFAALLHTGIHVGQDDLAPADVRRLIGPHALLGFSTHNPDQIAAAEAELIDYLAFGPVFPTASKERPDPTVGLETLKAVRVLTAKPLVAIGGITLENLLAVRRAGADSVAIIAALLCEPCTKQNLRARMTDWLHASAMLL
jgi:thiamine-phosphate pyrophosphorylase